MASSPTHDQLQSTARAPGMLSVTSASGGNPDGMSGSNSTSGASDGPLDTPKAPTHRRTKKAPKRAGYSGALDEDGEPHGRGTQKYLDGTSYEGEFEHGKIHGTGVFRYKSGAKFTGHFDMGKRHGRGKYAFVCGTTYEGDYLCDKRTGKGTMSFSEPAGKSVRTGRAGLPAPMKAGDPTTIPGMGPMTSVGLRYAGCFQDNMMHGPGAMQYASLAVFRGTFNRNLEHGPDGELEFNDGASKMSGPYNSGYAVQEHMLEHVVSGEKARLTFGVCGLITRQACVEAAGNSTPCGDFLVDPDDKLTRCGRCRAVRRPVLNDWLKPPELLSPDGMTTTSHGKSRNATNVAKPFGTFAEEDQQDEDDGGSSDDGIFSKPAAAAVKDGGDGAAVPDQIHTEDLLDDTIGNATTDSNHSRGGNEAVVVSFAAAAAAAAVRQEEDEKARRKVALDAVLAHADRIKREGCLPGLGVAIADCTPKYRGKSTPDVRVVRVARHSPAALASLSRGDYILAFNRLPVRTIIDLTSREWTVGERVTLTIQRRHAAESIPVVDDAVSLDASPATPPTAVPTETIPMTVGCLVPRRDFEAAERYAAVAAELVSADAAAMATGDVVPADETGPSLADLENWVKTLEQVHPTRHAVQW